MREKEEAKNGRGESGKPNNRPAPTSVSVRSSGEKEEMKWTVRLTGIYILSCAICVSELCRVTVRRIRSGKSVIITRARRSLAEASSSHRLSSIHTCTHILSFSLSLSLAFFLSFSTLANARARTRALFPSLLFPCRTVPCRHPSFVPSAPPLDSVKRKNK